MSPVVQSMQWSSPVNRYTPVCMCMYVHTVHVCASPSELKIQAVMSTQKKLSDLTASNADENFPSSEAVTDTVSQSTGILSGHCSLCRTV